MKIQSRKPAHHDTKRIFSRGIELTFDGDRIAEVSDEVGNFLLSRYPDTLCLPGKASEIKEVKQSTPQELSQVPLLKAKIDESQKNINGLEKQLKSSKEEVIVWKTECQRLTREIATYKERLFKYEGESTEEPPVTETSEGADTITDSNESSVEDLLRTELNKKKKEQLVEMAKELNLPASEWESLNKEPLVNYLVDKTK